MNLNKLTDNNSTLKIAVDGEAASGKGTLSKKIAKNYNLYYCQTSIFYRKLAKVSIDKNIDDLSELVNFASNIENFKNISNKGIYDEKVGSRSSEIASIKEIRYILNSHQKKILELYDRIIMEGRDIGTTIAPSADIKLYITANIETRAQRRLDQIKHDNSEITFDDVKRKLEIRDKMDKTREFSPLVMPKDAILIDNSNLQIEEFYLKAIEEISSFLDKNNNSNNIY